MLQLLVQNYGTCWNSTIFRHLQVEILFVIMRNYERLFDPPEADNLHYYERFFRLVITIFRRTSDSPTVSFSNRNLSFKHNVKSPRRIFLPEFFRANYSPLELFKKNNDFVFSKEQKRSRWKQDRSYENGNSMV
jgi:hypothetical protein